jgi:membrane protein
MKRVLKHWFGIFKHALNIWLEHNAFSYAGSLAFYTLFSLAPTVIIAVTILGVVLGEEAAQGQIVAQFQDVMGKEAAVAVEQAVTNSRIKESGILPTLAGILALIVGATTVFGQMQYSLNVLWGVTAKPDRNNIWLFIKKRIFSLMVVLSIGFVLLVSLVLGVALQAVLNFTSDFLPAIEALISGSELLVSLVIVMLLFATIFKVLPDVLLTWRQVLIGGLVTAILFSVGRYGIAAYLAHTATASTYGAAGSVVLILLWVYYSSLILLFGAAFTKAYLLSRGQKITPRNAAILVEKQFVQ